MVRELPKILKVERTTISPWLEVIARDVSFSSESAVETYYSIAQPDYVAVLAVTPDSRILLVRQYRPAIERFSLELPAGMVDPNEDALDTAKRELLEETGYPTMSIEPIGQCATCSSRISNATHSFFVRTGDRVAGFIEEPRVQVSSVLPSELRRLVLSGEFGEQTHLGVLAQASAKGLVAL
ncbi:NUDIX hydrolase [Bradyrhizobium diazoefficiens]|uniref:NUDIX hydrolase n=1 Tax=Bradyrhizobium diazoefficiens TaxID=1355477 RepID=UPI00190B3C89|nr:NUDIX hydrolase [Bradyrhizobium diazoefficiens]MBK3665389.1 NUDIX hydrolase [Bradyrhizobium diazoefficiens]